MKKINFVSKYEKKKMPGEKKFFFTVLLICVVAVAVTGFITMQPNNDISEPKSAGTKEVLKNSQEKITPPEYEDASPTYDVIVPESEEETETEKTPEIEVTKTNETKIAEIAEVDSVIMPTEGEIIKAHSDDIPVFSKTMNDWRIHQGIDIACNIGDSVYACASGTIKDIYNDDRLGATIVIEHNGFLSKYSNLSSVEGAVPGTQINQGDVVGVVGDTAKYEISDEAHLHFEIIKDDKSVNPLEYLK